MGIRDTLRDIGGSIAGLAGDGLLGVAEQLAKAREGNERAPGGSNEDDSDNSPVPTEKPDDPKTLFWDPYAVVEQLGYKERPSSITYGTLRAMVWKMPVAHAIIQTRVNQVASFCVPQKDRYSMGFRLKLRDSEKQPSPQDKKWQEKMTSFMLRTGVTDNPRGRDSFETFVRKFTVDALTLDQSVYEIVPDRKGRPAAFYAVDGATIRLADSASTYLNADLPDQVRYVQVYDGMIIAEYTEKELCFGVRNPRTDLRIAGYGVSELESAMTTVTNLLWALDYNANAFCMLGSSLVATAEGLKTVEALSGTEFQVWTPQGVKPARAFETAKKQIALTKLWNGLELKTSPDHRFRVIPSESVDGLAEWRTQGELAPGDHVLTAAHRHDAPMSCDLLVGKTYEISRKTARPFTVTQDLVDDSEFWEMLGFALGDGHWPGDSHNLQLFPHDVKDAEVTAKFMQVCERHSIKAQSIMYPGARGSRRIQIFHKAFISWLYDLGFQPSSQGKVVPAVLFRQPASTRESFLRGLFSADGHTRTHLTGYRTPTVTCVDPVMRQSILQCLWSVGVASSDVGRGPARTGEIQVQDIKAFVARVGYLQDYKNESVNRADQSQYRWDKLHPVTSRLFAQRVKSHADFPRAHSADRKMYHLIRKAAVGQCAMSRTRMIQAYEWAGYEIPEELKYHHAPVDYTEKYDDYEVMFDVEVFDDEHLFLANNMAVHNSQGSVHKGILNFKGTVPDKQMRAFRRHWYQQLSGSHNAFRTPITNADELQWIPMHQGNRDMEYNAYVDFLIKVLCSAYLIDPSEVNFKYGNTGQSGGLGESSNKEKIIESKERGLRPLLRFVANCLNQNIIWPISEDFEFEFVGLDATTRDDLSKLNTTRSKTTWTVDELRAEEDKDPLPDGLGEVILDPTWLQYAQAKQAEGQEQPGGEDAGFNFDDEPEEDDDVAFMRQFGTDAGAEEDDNKRAQGQPREADDVRKSLHKSSGQGNHRVILDLEL